MALVIPLGGVVHSARLLRTVSTLVRLIQGKSDDSKEALFERYRFWREAALVADVRSTVRYGKLPVWMFGR
jgi:hypothetical protein